MKMDTNQIFRDILHQIKKSRLNFMTKTPFSSQISLKNSLIKRFQTEDENVKPI
jgi:hypothetical protein